MPATMLIWAKVLKSSICLCLGEGLGTDYTTSPAWHMHYVNA